MDIVGAINHNLIVGAGVKSRTRIKNGIVEVQLRVPTKPKPTILVARMPLSEYAEQVGGHVGGKVGKKIKKAAKKVVKNKAFKALTKVATGLAKNMVPGAGLALKSAAALTKTAKKLSKKAKAGDKKAAALLKAPLKLKTVKPGTKPKGPTLAAPPRDEPSPVAPMRALPASTESADTSEDSGSSESEGSDESDDGAAEQLTSSEDEEEPVGAGAYMVTTPAGRKVKVTLP